MRLSDAVQYYDPRARLRPAVTELGSAVEGKGGFQFPEFHEPEPGWRERWRQAEDDTMASLTDSMQRIAMPEHYGGGAPLLAEIGAEATGIPSAVRAGLDARHGNWGGAVLNMSEAALAGLGAGEAAPARRGLLARSTARSAARSAARELPQVTEAGSAGGGEGFPNFGRLLSGDTAEFLGDFHVFPENARRENEAFQRLYERGGEVRNFALTDLTGTQQTVEPNFAEIARAHEADDLPMVYRVRGRNWVGDGHHRLADIAGRGESASDVRLYDIDKELGRRSLPPSGGADASPSGPLSVSPDINAGADIPRRPGFGGFNDRFGNAPDGDLPVTAAGGDGLPSRPDAGGGGAETLPPGALREIDDFYASVKLPASGVHRLEDVLDHPALFREFPELRGVEVRIGDMGEFAGGRTEGRTINLEPRFIGEMWGTDAKSILLHEVQHIIDKAEGRVVQGGTPDWITRNVARNGHLGPARDMYERLGTEQTAFATQRRANMTAAERAANDPFTSEPLGYRKVPWLRRMFGKEGKPYELYPLDRPRLAEITSEGSPSRPDAGGVASPPDRGPSLNTPEGDLTPSARIRPVEEWSQTPDTHDAFGRPLPATPAESPASAWGADIPTRRLYRNEAPPLPKRQRPPPQTKLQALSQASNLPWDDAAPYTPGIAAQARRYGTESAVDPRLAYTLGVGGGGAVGGGAVTVMNNQMPLWQQDWRENDFIAAAQDENDVMLNEIYGGSADGATAPSSHPLSPQAQAILAKYGASHEQWRQTEARR